MGWDPVKYPYTARNPSVHAIRHAMAIDERRWLFRQNRMYLATPTKPSSPVQQLEQQWFPGVHSDVGGGYAETDGGLWRTPFAWVLEGAEKAGLAIDANRKTTVLNVTKPSATPCDDLKHESLQGAWWLAEFLPKMQWRDDLRRSALAVDLGRHRDILEGELINKCALERLCDRTDYRPKNLCAEFVCAVQALPSVPGALAYTANADGLKTISARRP
jgi:uncharacterized protein (DUF2235 family)